MPKLTQQVHIPGPLYLILPWVYFLTGLTIWIFVDMVLGKLFGIALILFGAVILVQRLSNRR